MLEAEADVAYSDEKFVSEHEYEDGNDDFADEDTIVAGVQQIIKPEIPTDGGEKDTEQYNGDFDADEHEVTPGLSMLEADFDSSLTGFNVPLDDGQYDEEFGDDGKAAVVYNSSTWENGDAFIDSVTVAKRLPDEATCDGDFDEEESKVGATVDSIHDTTIKLASVPHDDKETGEVLVQVDDSTGMNNGNEPKFSNEEQDLTTVTVPVSMNLLPKDSIETVPQRRSSVPSSGASQSEGYRVDRAGSLPPVLPHDKWMATIPQEVSLKRCDRSRKPSACFPVQEEAFQQNVIGDEDKYTDADNSIFESNASGIRERAQSLRDLQCEKVSIPLRRAQSLLYTGLLPRVEEVHAAEETTDALQNSDDEEDYSEDKSSGGEDSFESNYDSDEVRAEDTSNGPSPATARGNKEGDHPAINSISPSDLLTTNEQDPLNGSNNDNDCVDKMEKEFPSGSHYESEDIPHSSIDEANDYEVDDFIEDEGHETKSQRESPQLEIKAAEPGPDQPLVMPICTGVGDSPAIPEQPNGKNYKQNGDGKYEPSGDDNFIDNDAETPAYEVPDPKVCEETIERQLYDHDADDFKVGVEQQDKPLVTEGVNGPKKENSSVEVKEDTQPATEMGGSGKKATNTEAETAAPPSEYVVITIGEGLDQPSDASQPIEASPTENQVEKDQKNTSARSKALPKPSRPENVNVNSRLARPQQLVKAVDPPAKQPSPRLNPSRPPSMRAASIPEPHPVSITTTTTSPQSPRNHVKNTTTNPSTPADSATESDPITSIRQRSLATPRQKVYSSWSPSLASSGPYQYIPLDYPQIARKEPVPRQKMGSKPSSSHGAKRRLLQPVRTPANKRFDFSKMDKAKRDWVFVNMFRHGDDLTNYETFMPPALLARPPTMMKIKKRPISARQMYGNTHSSQSTSSGRKLVSQSGLEVKDLKRNWVSTTPHDSKLPQYDSILDKHCTTVTSPMVQRQIYRTRHRDLSPQLAYVLEKRVEQHYRQGVYDSFGGVSTSYRTEIVPTFPRPRSHA